MVPDDDIFEAAQVFCPGGTVYTIRPGDSLFSLAQRFNTTVQAITAANPGIDPANLQLGQRICIPVAPTPSPCPGGFLYTIRAGETFFSIARRFGIAVAALAAANPGIDTNQLRIGQQIYTGFSSASSLMGLEMLQCYPCFNATVKALTTAIRV